MTTGEFWLPLKCAGCAPATVVVSGVLCGVGFAAPFEFEDVLVGVGVGVVEDEEYIHHPPMIAASKTPLIIRSGSPLLGSLLFLLFILFY